MSSPNCPTPPSQSRLLSTWGVAILLTLLTLNFWLWLSCRDYTGLASENAKHLSKAYAMHFVSQSEGWGAALNTITYPPLFYLPAVALFSITGVHSESLALASLWPFILLTAGATFGLARRLALPMPESLTASFLCATALGVSLQEDGYIIEYALVGLVSVALYLFIASDYLQRRLPSILLGLVCGWGVLTKWTFVAYLFCAVAITLAVIAKNKPRAPRLKNLGWTLAIFLLLAHTWYGAVHVNANLGTTESNFHATFAHFEHSQATEIAVREEQVAQEEGDGFVWGAPALVLYLIREVVPAQVTPCIIWGLALALITLRQPGSQRRHLGTILLTFGFILVLFTLYPSPRLFSTAKTLRHLGPAVPLALVLAVFGLPKLGRLRIAALVLLNGLGVISALGWMLPPNPQLHSLWIRPQVFGVRHWLYGDPLGLLTVPKQSPLTDLAHRLAQDANQGHMPLFCFGVEQDFQPLLVELYGQGGPAALALRRHGEIIFLDGKTQFTEPDTPVLDISEPLYVYQDHCILDGNGSEENECAGGKTESNGSVGGYTTNGSDEHAWCRLDRTNLAVIRSLLQAPGTTPYRGLDRCYEVRGLRCLQRFYVLAKQ